MHAEAYAFVERTLATLPAPQRVVDFGGRNVNGTIRPLMPRSARYTVVDLRYDRSVDYVADAAEWGEADAYDMVICTETLEHAKNAAAIVTNAARILAPGGFLIMTMATDPRAPHSGMDGGAVHPGEHYANIAYRDLLAWVDRSGLTMRQYEVHDDRGDLYLLAVK